jgi:hypothetical protein
VGSKSTGKGTDGKKPDVREMIYPLKPGVQPTKRRGYNATSGKEKDFQAQDAKINQDLRTNHFQSISGFITLEQ